jgi:hypothetical protein
MHKLRLLFLEDSEAREAILVLMGVRRVCRASNREAVASTVSER